MHLPDNSAWAVKNVVASDNGLSIANAIRNGTCKAVSDGSFKDAHGTACWVLEGTSADNRIYAPSVVPGHPSDQSAYRSELAGLYGIGTIIGVICKMYEIEQGQVEFACDGLQALERCAELNHRIRPRQPQFDLIEATRKVMKDAPIKWSSRHVKGHQDNFYGPLDQWAHMNVFCDTVAKLHWADTTQHPTAPQITIAGEPWSLWIKTKKIATDMEVQINEHIHGQRAIEYWIKHKKFPPESIKTIDTKATKRAMQAATLTRQHWVSKHSADICGTNINMVKWQLRTSTQCPRCSHPTETATHVWLCPATKEHWEQAMDRLDAWLQTKHSSPELTKALLAGLRSWHDEQPPPESHTTFPGLKNAVRSQNIIGWQNLFEGYWANDWEAVQTTYFRWIGRVRKDKSLQRRTGRRWLTAVIQKLWEIAWDLWDDRNSIVHDKEQGIELKQLHANIKHQISLGKLHLTTDTQALFDQARKSSFLKRPLAYKKAWLLRVVASRQRTIRRRTRDHDSEAYLRNGMRNYLNHGSTNPLPHPQYTDVTHKQPSQKNNSIYK